MNKTTIRGIPIIWGIQNIDGDKLNRCVQLHAINCGYKLKQTGIIKLNRNGNYRTTKGEVTPTIHYDIMGNTNCVRIKFYDKTLQPKLGCLWLLTQKDKDSEYELFEASYNTKFGKLCAWFRNLFS